MTRDKLLAWVDGYLDQNVAALYHAADQYARDCRDTLSDDFQLAAAVVKVFEDWAEKEEAMGP